LSWRRRNSNKRKSKAVAYNLCWATFAKEALPSSLTDNPQDSDDAVDHSEKQDGKATNSYPHSRKKVKSFTAYATDWDTLLDSNGIPTDGTPPDPLQSQKMAEQMGIPSIDEEGQGLGQAPGSGSPQTPPGLKPAPPGAHDKAAQKRRAGRGVEGEGDMSPSFGDSPSGLPSPPPGAHEKAAQKRRAGRGVEGVDSLDPSFGDVPSSPAPSTPPGLKPAPPGAHDKAAQKRRAGRGIEGEEGAGLGCSTGPSNPMDNQNPLDWDALVLPGQPPLSNGN